MRLKAVRVSEFKSIRDSESFEIGDVTCLVGKNEAGKTALLEALYRLNPIVDTHGTFDVTYDYPKSEVEDYRQAVENGARKPANVVTATYGLDSAEVAAIESAFGEGII